MNDRVAVVTGGASGIGRAGVLRFLDAGYRVVFGDLNRDNAQRVVEEVGDAQRLRFAPTDVAEEDDVAALVAEATGAFGRIDVMFNNAGVGGAFGPITEIAADDWDRTFAVLVRSVFLGTKHAARAMIDQGDGGSIVNTASVAGLSGGGGPQAYSAAKAAVINLTLSTAVELAVHRIRVNAICPGLINTPLAIRHDRDADRVRELLSTIQPWPELGRPDDIAALVLWLAGPDSVFVTGEAIRVDGGVTAAGPGLVSMTDPNGAFARSAGFADGTTGRPPVKRRLRPRPPASPRDER
ncbi:MAG: SDR family NAD(P)-dependent oxidoreductase [Ilumatobacteraceae bacterium]